MTDQPEPYLEDWNPKYWIVVINDDLIHHRIERSFKGKGIKAFWGTDPYKHDTEKLMYVYYPKSDYTETYIRSQVLPKYRNCPLCKIGQKKSSNIFKYKKNKDMSNIKINNNNDKKMALPKLRLPTKAQVKAFLKDERGQPLVGQGLAQIPKNLISMATTDLGSKIINSLLGGIITLGNEMTKKNPYIRDMGYNMFWTFADPTANQLRAIKRNADDIIAGAKRHDFSTFQGGILEDPAEIRAAIQSLIPKMGNFFNSFKNFASGLKGGFGRIKVPTKASLIQPEKLVTTYGRTKEHFIDY